MITHPQGCLRWERVAEEHRDALRDVFLWCKLPKARRAREALLGFDPGVPAHLRRYYSAGGLPATAYLRCLVMAEELIAQFPLIEKTSTASRTSSTRLLGGVHDPALQVLAGTLRVKAWPRPPGIDEAR